MDKKLTSTIAKIAEKHFKENQEERLPKELADKILMHNPQLRFELEKEAFINYQESEDYPHNDTYKSLTRVTYELMQRANYIEHEWMLWRNFRGIAKKSLSEFYLEAMTPCFIADRMAVDSEPLLDVLNAIINAAVAIDRWERKFKRLKGGWIGNQKGYSDRLMKWHRVMDIAIDRPGIKTEALARLAKKKLKISRSAFYRLKKEFEWEENGVTSLEWYRSQKELDRKIQELIEKKPDN